MVSHRNSQGRARKLSGIKEGEGGRKRRRGSARKQGNPHDVPARPKKVSERLPLIVLSLKTRGYHRGTGQGAVDLTRGNNTIWMPAYTGMTTIMTCPSGATLQEQSQITNEDFAEIFTKGGFIHLPLAGGNKESVASFPRQSPGSQTLEEQRDGGARLRSNDGTTRQRILRKNPGIAFQIFPAMPMNRLCPIQAYCDGGHVGSPRTARPAR